MPLTQEQKKQLDGLILQINIARMAQHGSLTQSVMQVADALTSLRDTKPEPSETEANIMINIAQSTLTLIQRNNINAKIGAYNELTNDYGMLSQELKKRPESSSSYGLLIDTVAVLLCAAFMTLCIGAALFSYGASFGVTLAIDAACMAGEQPPPVFTSFMYLGSQPYAMIYPDKPSPGQGLKEAIRNLKTAALAELGDKVTPEKSNTSTLRN